MHKTAKSCLAWGIVLLVAGPFVLTYFPSLLYWINGSVGPTGQIGLDLLGFAMLVVQGTLMPLGVVLIGAGIVINALKKDETVVASQQGREL